MNCPHCGWRLVELDVTPSIWRRFLGLPSHLLVCVSCLSFRKWCR